MGARVLRKSDPNEVTDADLVGMLRFLAMAVELYGAVYMPLFERIESEITSRRAKADPITRVRRVLELYTIEGGVKAIR